MKTFTPLDLTDSQKQILTAYANACNPTIYAPGKRVPSDQQMKDLAFLNNTGLIDKGQNHISDRGAAYVFTQCGFPFDRFIKVHKWQERLATRILVGKQIAENQDAENYYHLKRYELLIKYNVFGPNNAEGNPANMGQMITELFASLVNSELFDWQKLKAFLFKYDIYDDQDLIATNSRESFAAYIEKANRLLA